MPSGNTQATLYLGNLDDRVDERLLYDIMVQAGPLVEVYIPRDKESKRHRGYAFAEYTTEQSANYALKLFSGLVTLYNKSVHFAISGGDKKAQQLKEENLVTPDQKTPSKFHRFLSASEREPSYSSGKSSIPRNYSSRVALLSQRTNRYSPY